MANRKKSARERTGLYMLAAVLAGLGGGAAVAAPHKKSETLEKKAVAVQGVSKKPKSGRSRKKSQKSMVGSEMASAAAILSGGNLPIGKEDKFRPTLSPDYVPTDLVRLPAEFAYEAGKAIRLRAEAAASMQKMIRDAAAEGLTLKVVSAYRDVAHQKRLYEAAIKKYGKGQKMVGRPGRSEHFLGTTVDVSNANAAHLLQADFAKSAEYRWLEANAPKYGWKFTVRAGMHGRKPHQDEPWHIRYMGTPSEEVVSAPTEVASAQAENPAGGEAEEGSGSGPAPEVL